MDLDEVRERANAYAVKWKHSEVLRRTLLRRLNIEMGLDWKGVVDYLKMYPTQAGALDEKGKPWKVKVIIQDLANMLAEWKDREGIDDATARAIKIAELTAVKTAAWAEKDRGVVLAAIKQEIALRGIEAPKKVEHGGKDMGPITIITGVPHDDDD